MQSFRMPVFSVVYLYDGDRLRMAAANNYTSEALRHAQALASQPERSHLAGRAVLDRAIVHVQDVLADPDYSRELALAGDGGRYSRFLCFATASQWAPSQWPRLKRCHFRTDKSNY